MDFIIMIIVGAIAGTIASYIMKSPTGLFMDIILGIIGAVVGGMIMNALGQSGAGGFNLYSILVAVFGAIVVIALYRMLFGKRMV